MTFEVAPLRRSYGRENVHRGGYFKGKYGTLVGLITIAMMLQRLSRGRRLTVNPLCMPPASTQVLMIEEYIQRRRETIMKYAETRNIYGKCKSS
jgi:hypothetical protein